MSSKAVKAVNSVRPARLRASVFLSALELMFDGTVSYTCHAVSRADGFEPQVVSRDPAPPELAFYETTFTPPEYPFQHIPPCFSRGGVSGQAGPITDAELYTTRIVALQLAALLVEDGFYVDARGELAQRRKRKPAKK